MSITLHYTVLTVESWGDERRIVSVEGVDVLLVPIVELMLTRVLVAVVEVRRVNVVQARVPEPRIRPCKAADDRNDGNVQDEVHFDRRPQDEAQLFRASLVILTLEDLKVSNIATYEV